MSSLDTSLRTKRDIVVLEPRTTSPSVCLLGWEVIRTRSQQHNEVKQERIEDKGDLR